MLRKTHQSRLASFVGRVQLLILLLAFITAKIVTMDLYEPAFKQIEAALLQERNGDYSKALTSYSAGLDAFTAVLQRETDHVRAELIRSNIAVYHGKVAELMNYLQPPSMEPPPSYAEAVSPVAPQQVSDDEVTSLGHSLMHAAADQDNKVCIRE